MRILFLGDVVGIAGRSKVLSNLKAEIEKKKINFVILNGENSDDTGVGLTKNICNDFFNCNKSHFEQCTNSSGALVDFLIFSLTTKLLT